MQPFCAARTDSHIEDRAQNPHACGGERGSALQFAGRARGWHEGLQWAGRALNVACDHGWIKRGPQPRARRGALRGARARESAAPHGLQPPTTPQPRPNAHAARLQAVDAPGAAAFAALAERVRSDVPVLDQRVHGRPLVYLDNAATSQKPRAVLEAMDRYYTEYNSNVHRGVHHLSALATDAYEAARQKVARFIGAATDREVVFTRNASEAVNLVAYSWGMTLKPGDEVRRACSRFWDRRACLSAESGGAQQLRACGSRSLAPPAPPPFAP